MQRGCPDAVKSIKFLGVFGALCDISHGIVFGGQTQKQVFLSAFVCCFFAISSRVLSATCPHML